MANKKFTTALYGSLKRLVWADHFYDGDLSFLNNSFDSPEKVLEYLPVYEHQHKTLGDCIYVPVSFPSDHFVSHTYRLLTLHSH